MTVVFKITTCHPILFPLFDIVSSILFWQSEVSANFIDVGVSSVNFPDRHKEFCLSFFLCFRSLRKLWYVIIKTVFHSQNGVSSSSTLALLDMH